MILIERGTLRGHGGKIREAVTVQYLSSRFSPEMRPVVIPVYWWRSYTRQVRPLNLFSVIACPSQLAWILREPGSGSPKTPTLPLHYSHTARIPHRLRRIPSLTWPVRAKPGVPSPPKDFLLPGTDSLFRDRIPESIQL